MRHPDVCTIFQPGIICPGQKIAVIGMALFLIIRHAIARLRAKHALVRTFSNQILRPKPVSHPDGPEQGNWPEADVYRTVTVTARRFWAQDCSSEPNADGRSLP